jgi:regulator of replication initiation timing
MPNEHDHLVSMMNQLIDEREILSRENEYLKSKLNESVLVETINEMKKERDLLFKLLSNLTMNCSKDDHIRFIKRFVKEK